MTETPHVALLGTGTMGSGMARSIARAGLPLRVWNRTRSRADPLAGDGIEVADSVAEAVKGADVLLTMLYDAAAVAEVIEEAGEALGSDTVWIQSSTVGLDGERRLAALAAERGIVYLDAPVLGTKQPAENGELVVLASGPEEARGTVAPVLDAIGTRTLWVGENGEGSRLKLAVNAWVFAVVEGVAESLALARALGLDAALFLEAIRGSGVDAPYVRLKGGAMLAGNFDPSFALATAVKDAELIDAAAREAGLDVEVLDAVRAHFQRGVDAGYGDLDMSATYLAHEPRRVAQEPSI